MPSREDRRKFLRRALESFDYARFRGAGDCEDLALEILLEAAEMLALDNTQQQQQQQLSKNLRAMIALRRRYVFAMALGGVSSAEINGDFGELTEMEAHMQVFHFFFLPLLIPVFRGRWSVMIPRALFRHWWQRGNLSAEADARLFGSSPSPIAAGDVPLILEGTGFLCPTAVSAATEQQVTLEEHYQKLFTTAAPSAFSGVRKVFHYRTDRKNSFYQSFSLLFTNEFIRNTGAAGIAR